MEKFKYYIRNTIILYITSCIIASISIYGAHVYLMMYNRSLSLLMSLWKDVKIVMISRETVEIDRLEGLISRLNQREDVDKAWIISSEEGWQLLHNEEDLIPALQSTENNPLPDIIVIMPVFKYKKDFSLLLSTLQNLPDIESVKYNLKKMQKLLIYADQFQFVHRGIVWMFIALCVCLLLYGIRFLLLPDFKQYIGIITAQGITGGVGAVIGWIIFVMHFQTIETVWGVFASIPPMVVVTGIGIGWTAGLFIFSAYEPLQRPGIGWHASRHRGTR